MRIKLLIGILSIVLFACIAASALTAAYAWLTPGQPVSFDAKGNAIAGYFHSGTGTQAEPYILTSPKHLYNLAWLQYLGTFNVTDENGNLKQFFFKLGDDIDMVNSPYRVLPPIGTTRYPFVGNFDGNNKTISNAIVANIIDPDNNQISEFPPALLQEGSDRQNALQNVEIIGFFGVIGEYEEGSLGFTLTDAQLEYLGVKDLVLKNVAVQTSTDKSLAGLVAGFVNGNLENVYVSSGTITARPDATTLRDDNVLSAYSLIGNYETTKINWIGGPMDGPTSDSGPNAGFGGSIDMLSLAKRVTYMFGAADGSKLSNYDDQYTLNATIRSTYHIYGRTQVNSHSGNGSPKYYFTYEKNNYFAFANDTYLPLNIVTENITQSYYTAKTTEELLNNTGYIVGTGNCTATTSSDPPIQLWSVPLGKLYYALNGYTTSVSDYANLKYSNSKLQILTIDVNGKYHVIGDSYNGLTSGTSQYYNHADSTYNATITQWGENGLGLTQYLTGANVRDKITQLLEGGRICALKLGSIPSKDAVLSTSVNLGEKSVNSLVKGTIHFNLDRSGVITMALATIGGTTMQGPATGGVSSNMPVLYRVTRENGTITDLEAITTIHTKGGLYAYNGFYEKSATEKIAVDSSWTPVYDYDNMGYLSLKHDGSGSFIKQYANSLFYFEIPVGAGEYVFGCQEGENIAVDPTALILFLDIGANAGTQGSGGGSGGSGSVADPTGELTGVYFVDANGNPILQEDVTPDEGKTKPAVAFEIKLNNTNGVSVSFEGTETGVNVAITPTNGATAEQVKMKKEEETTGS